MSQIDRLSNSGPYPTLPVTEQRGARVGREDRARQQPRDPADATPDEAARSGRHRIPKSLIDEYA